jgi:hypothetical protein
MRFSPYLPNFSLDFSRIADILISNQLSGTFLLQLCADATGFTDFAAQMEQSNKLFNKDGQIK